MNESLWLILLKDKYLSQHNLFLLIVEETVRLVDSIWGSTCVWYCYGTKGTNLEISTRFSCVSPLLSVSTVSSRPNPHFPCLDYCSRPHTGFAPPVLSPLLSVHCPLTCPSHQTLSFSQYNSSMTSCSTALKEIFKTTESEPLRTVAYCLPVPHLLKPTESCSLRFIHHIFISRGQQVAQHFRAESPNGNLPGLMLSRTSQEVLIKSWFCFLFLNFWD